MTVREILLAVGDWIQLAGFVPSLYFIIDYGIIRPRLFATDAEGERIVDEAGNPVRRFQPWWDAWLGIMFFTLGLAFFASSTVVGLSLWLGTEYPGREFIRIFGYLVSTGSIWLMAIVYTLERNTASSVLVPPARH